MALMQIHTSSMSAILAITLNLSISGLFVNQSSCRNEEYGYNARSFSGSALCQERQVFAIQLTTDGVSCCFTHLKKQ